MNYQKSQLCARDNIGNKIYFLDERRFVGRMNKRDVHNISSLILMMESSGEYEIIGMRIKSKMIIFTVDEYVANNKNP